MEIVTIDKENLHDICKDRKNYIFGASDTGKKLLGQLLEHGIGVLGIWDNDVEKQGKDILGVPIISYEELAKEHSMNLFLGCAYALQEEARIDALYNVSVFQVGKTKEELKERFQKEEDYFPIYIEESRRIQEMYADDISKEVSEALIRFITEYDGSATRKIATDEEHYFIKEVLETIGERKLTYVDCGAFTGELPKALNKMNLEYNTCYCFEMEKKNLLIAKQNLSDWIENKQVILEQKGISSQNGYLYYESKGACSYLVDYETDERVEVTTLDSYFKDISVDFIKMDIEGAELGALMGGIGIIKRDRPILAISVYHSLRDRTEIFDYLYNNLVHYKYYLRQHSIWAAETVLYAIPADE